MQDALVGAGRISTSNYIKTIGAEIHPLEIHLWQPQSIKRSTSIHSVSQRASDTLLMPLVRTANKTLDLTFI